MEFIVGLCKKHKEVIAYLFFGGLTFLVSIFSFALFNQKMGINELIANIFSWIIAVAFAYVTNRTWVFESKSHGARNILSELARFVSGRLATLVMEELILFVFITLLHYNSMAVKIVAQVLVILGNYVISKLFVFRASK